jgi:hypothetical protein
LEDGKLAMDCGIGRALFMSEAKKLRYASFVKSIEETLEDVFHLDFDATAYSGFRKASAIEAHRVLEMESNTFEKTQAPIKFCDERIDFTLCSLHDEYGYRAECRYKELAISAGLLEPYPWEQLLWNGKPIEGMGSHCRVPETLLAQSRNTRKAVKAIFEGTQEYTLQQMLNTVRSNVPDLMNLEKMFIIEFTFLEQQAQRVLVASVRAEALALMPDGSATQMAPEKGIASIMRIRSTYRCVAAGSSLVREIEGVEDMLKNIMDFSPPSTLKFATFSDFFKNVIKKLEHYAIFEEVVEYFATGGMLKGQKKVTYGQPAVMMAYDKGLANPSPGKTEEMDMLRKFAWLLDAAENEQISLAVKQFVQRQKEHLLFGGWRIKDGTADDVSACKKFKGAITVRMQMFQQTTFFCFTYMCFEIQ